MNNDGYRVLVVDDEPEIRRFLRATLKIHQHQVIEADCGMKAIAEIRDHNPDLMILDLGLPDIDGIEVTRRVRAWNQVPIIVLSVRRHEVDKIEALNAGADDYLTKPFSVGELLARIHAVMRRVDNTGTKPICQVGDLMVDFNRHQVKLAEKEIDLTPTEFEIISILIQNAGKVVTQPQLLRKVWGAAYEDETRLLRVNISNLRRKIEPNPNQPTYILTELGVGYRMKDF